ncbi:MAG: hypothetical protein ABSF49_07355 [Roseiarcus sp.]|jgi:hypothetical protein|uniref:hypothetical protein n=1 Tax=Roseiarcus sp. TaxID=1969460 RepID=UPI003C17B433
MPITPSWRPLGGVDAKRLGEARLQAHYAVQWLARLARAAVPPQPDDSHTNLGWDDELDGFVTHRLRDGGRLGLRLSDLTLSAEDGAAGRPQRSFSLVGRSDAEAREWVGLAFAADGLDAQALDALSPYAMPSHAIARGGNYGGADLSAALVDLAAWFANGRTAVEKVRGAMLGHGCDAPAPRCWPHHFDLATLTSFPLPRRATTAYIGVGLSPGDRFYGEPYFYLSVYPAPDPSALPKLPPLGHWRVEDFTGAVATATAILATARPEAETDAFLAAALEAALALCR